MTIVSLHYHSQTDRQRAKENNSHYRLNGLRHSSFRAVRSPTLETVGLGAEDQPNHVMTTFFAKISPNPSMTPLTKGRSRLTASAEKNATVRVLVDSEESKIARVAEGGGSVDGLGCCGAGGGVSMFSGNVSEGNEDAIDGTSSHFWDPSSVSSSDAGGAGTEAWA